MLRSISFACLAMLPLLGWSDAQVVESRARLAEMPSAERDELARALQRFEKLSATDRQSLIALDEAIENSGQRDELRQVLANYYEWVKQLPSEQRSELRMLSSARRLEKVQEIVSRQRREASQSRIIEDFEKTIAWTQAYAAEHESEIMALLDPRAAAGVRRLPESHRPKRLSMELWQRWYRSNDARPELTAADLRALVEQLSPQSRAAIRQTQSPRDQWRSLIDYFSSETVKTLPPEEQRRIGNLNERERLALLMRLAMQTRFNSQEVSGTALRKMFAALSQEERERLIQLSPEELKKELRYRYLRSRVGDRPGPPPPPGEHPRRGPRGEHHRLGPHEKGDHPRHDGPPRRPGARRDPERE